MPAPPTKQPSKKTVDAPATTPAAKPTAAVTPAAKKPVTTTKPKQVGLTPVKETSSQVHAPVEKPDVVMTEVPQKLELNHIFGYRCQERRNNLFYLPTALNATDNDLLVYVAGSVGIIHQKSTNQQVFLQGHDDDVLGLAVHPNRFVATGQVGRDATINVYQIKDTKFGKVPETQLLKTLKVPRGSNGINGLAFNKDADLLFAFTRGDPNNEVLIYDWQNEKLLTSTRVSNKILDLVGSPYKKNEFIVVGVKYIAFGNFQNGKLDLKRAEFGNTELIQALPCACYISEDTVLTGTSKGDVYIWKNQKFVKKSAELILQGTILSIRKHDVNVFIGGKEGKIVLADAELKVLDHFTLIKDQADDAELPFICSIDVSGDKKQYKLLIGLRNCNIIEADVQASSFQNPKQIKLVNAHDNHKDQELWGLDVKQNIAVSCGDDGFIKVWHLLDRKCVVKIKVGAARAVTWHPKLNKIACGLRNGQVYVFEGDDKCLNWTQMNKFTVSNRDVTIIKYSPNGKYLITGAADGKIDVYDAANNHTRLGEMSGHTSRIISCDWNTDSNFLISNSTDKEVLYWDVEQLKQLTHLDTIKQLKWATYQCHYSWSTMGIWQQDVKVRDATDINCVDTHQLKKLVADGTDSSLVQLWNWPRPKSKAPARKI